MDERITTLENRVEDLAKRLNEARIIIKKLLVGDITLNKFDQITPTDYDSDNMIEELSKA